MTTQIRNEQIQSESAASGTLLTADGAGGADWVAPAAAGDVGHVHALDRWAGLAAQTVLYLTAFAELIEYLAKDGTLVDPLNYTLSDDQTQVTLSSALSGGEVVTAGYVVTQV